VRVRASIRDGRLGVATVIKHSALTLLSLQSLTQTLLVIFYNKYVSFFKPPLCPSITFLLLFLPWRQPGAQVDRAQRAGAAQVPGGAHAVQRRAGAGGPQAAESGEGLVVSAANGLLLQGWYASVLVLVLVVLVDVITLVGEVWECEVYCLTDFDSGGVEVVSAVLSLCNVQDAFGCSAQFTSFFFFRTHFHSCLQADSPYGC